MRRSSNERLATGKTTEYRSKRAEGNAEKKQKAIREIFGLVEKQFDRETNEWITKKRTQTSKLHDDDNITLEMKPRTHSLYD